VYLHAETNVDWSGRRNTLAPVITPPITGYTGNSTRAVTVPVLDENEKTSWTDNGTGNVETKIWYGPEMDGNGQPAPANYFVVSQAPYTLTPSTSNITINSVTVSVSTAAACYKLELKTTTGSSLASTNGLTTVKSNTFNIGTNKTGSARKVLIVNGVTGKEIGSFNQPVPPNFVLLPIMITYPYDSGGSPNFSIDCPDGTTWSRRNGVQTNYTITDIYGNAITGSCNEFYRYDIEFYWVYGVSYKNGIIISVVDQKMEGFYWYQNMGTLQILCKVE
jgi:hypothetical protein